MNDRWAPLKMFAELTKLKLAAAASLSTATGSFLFLHRISWSIVTASIGVLLLALGSCAFNQIQDRRYDACMNRTCRRPVAEGRLSCAAARGIAALLMASGFTLLGMIHGLVPVLLGGVAVLLYNGFYTYLKRVWAFAAVPGAVIGAIPPLIGWMAAGGNFMDPRILVVAFFFFIWQAPHFWMLLFLCGKEYEEAGLPALTQIFSLKQFGRITFFWILITAASGLLFPFYGVVSSLWICFALLMGSIALIAAATPLLCRKHSLLSLRRAFHAINAYALLVMLLLIASALGTNYSIMLMHLPPTKLISYDKLWYWKRQQSSQLIRRQ
jgi:protoheme IX farnesyltransferase